MAVLNISGAAVIGGCIVIPQRGAWTADLTVATGDDLPDDVTISTASGSLEMRGYRYRSTVFAQTVTVRVVGGSGGLRNVIPAKGYQVVPAVQVAQDIVADCGETLSAASASVLGDVLTHWARPKGPAEGALSQLADHLGLVWRVSAGGEVLFVDDSFADMSTDGVALNYDASEGEISLGVADFDGAVQPGTSYDGRRVYCVVHHVGDVLRTTLHFDGDGDRIRGTLRRIVESSLPSYSLRSFYSGRMVAQAGASVDFVPDDDTVPGMQRVPLLLGVPGLSIQAAPGARIGMGFYGGDGSKPYAGLFDSGTLLSYALTCPSIQLGAASATPVAHAIEALAGLQAIAAPLAAIHASVSAATPATPVTNGTLAGFLAPLAAIPAAVTAATVTMPTLTTRIA